MDEDRFWWQPARSATVNGQLATPMIAVNLSISPPGFVDVARSVGLDVAESVTQGADERRARHDHRWSLRIGKGHRQPRRSTDTGVGLAR